MTGPANLPAGWRKTPPGVAVAGLSPMLLQCLIARIDAAPLFAHSYSHHLNFRFGVTTPSDLLRFASDHGLAGLKIHVEDGEERSLFWMGRHERLRFAAEAAERGLRLHVETSSTTRPELEIATAIARDISAESIRCYPRYEGRVSEITDRTTADLRILRTIDPDSRFRFTLEQHEDLKSHELVRIVRDTGDPRLTLMFDFGNMINAAERPEAALAVMAPLVTEVHIKDVKVIDDRGGWAHLACRTGEGHIDFHPLLRDLLLLGERTAQVTAFGLEEEDGMFAPAYRFPGEEADPFIPARPPSTTELCADEPADRRLAREREEAARQVSQVKTMLSSLCDSAVRELKSNEAMGEQS